MTQDNGARALADLSIVHAWLHDYDVPPERSAAWQVGDWHCACGWFGNHGWMGYASHLEAEAAAPSPEPLPREALDVERLARAMASVEYQVDPSQKDIRKARRYAAEYAALSPDRPTPPADPDPTIGMQIVKCPHCGEELSVWPPDRPTPP